MRKWLERRDLCECYRRYRLSFHGISSRSQDKGESNEKKEGESSHSHSCLDCYQVWWYLDIVILHGTASVGTAIVSGLLRYDGGIKQEN